LVVFEYAREVAEKEMQAFKYAADFLDMRLLSDTFQRTNCAAFLVTIIGAQIG
jgi:hypothetical protein